MPVGNHIPSKIRTAVGKSLTLLAAFKAAVRTEGEGTRSYAKALLRFRYNHRTIISKSAGTRARSVDKRMAAIYSIPEAQRHLVLGRTPSHIYILAPRR